MWSLRHLNCYCSIQNISMSFIHHKFTIDFFELRISLQVFLKKINALLLFRIESKMGIFADFDCFFNDCWHSDSRWVIVNIDRLFTTPNIILIIKHSIYFPWNEKNFTATKFFKRKIWTRNSFTGKIGREKWISP